MGAMTTGTAIAIAAASTAAQAGLAIMSAKSQAQAPALQAELSGRQAQREKEIGELQASQEREANKRVQGTQRALLAARGGDPGTGSALLVQEELAEEGEFNAQVIENNAAARVNTFEADRVLQQARSKQIAQSGLFRAGSTLLSGASSIATAFAPRPA
jgi:hypothetical protein